MNDQQSPDEIEDNDAELEAFALGVLDEHEQAALIERMEGSPELRRRAAEAQAVTWLLASSPPQLTPRAELKDRILAAVRAEEADAAPAAPPAPPRPINQPRRGRLPWGGGWAPWAVAAALVLMLGLAGWNVSLQQQVARQQARLAQTQAALQTLGGADRFWTMQGDPTLAQSATSVLALNQARKETVLVVRGFPPLPAGQAYQVWIIVNGQPVSAGVFAPESPESEHTLIIPSDLSNVSQAAITIEPAGGSLSPTGQKVMAGNL